MDIPRNTGHLSLRTDPSLRSSTVLNTSRAEINTFADDRQDETLVSNSNTQAKLLDAVGKTSELSPP